MPLGDRIFLDLFYVAFLVRSLHPPRLGYFARALNKNQSMSHREQFHDAELKGNGHHPDTLSPSQYLAGVLCVLLSLPLGLLNNFCH